MICRSQWGVARWVVLASLAVAACTKSSPPTVVPMPSADALGLESHAATLAATPSATAAVAEPHEALWGWSGLAAATAATPIDVLVRAGAPGLDAAAVERFAAPIAAAWRGLAGVEHVVTVADAGELRALVRFGQTTPSVAQAAVLGQWPSATAGALVLRESAAIQRGNRARVAWAWTSDRGDRAATLAAEHQVSGLAKVLKGVAQFRLAGAVRPVLFADVLTKTVGDNRTTLTHTRDCVLRALAGAQPEPTQDAVAAQASFAAMLEKTSVAGSGPAGGSASMISAGRLIALRRGLGEPVQAAIVGRNAAPVLFGEAGLGAAVDHLASEEAAWRRDPTTKVSLGDVVVHPQTVEAAYRYVLEPKTASAEPPAELAKRLLAVRETPSIVAVVAANGLDGVPMALQAAGRSDAVWTVWVSVSSAGAPGETALRSAELTLSSGPWQVRAVPANLDTGLAWVLATTAAAGALISASDSLAVQDAARTIGQALLDRKSLIDIRSGPIKRPLPPAATRWRPQAWQAAGVPPAAAQFADALLQGPQLAGEFAGITVWFDLPHGIMQAEQGSLPLLWRPTASDPVPTRLDDLLQPASAVEGIARVRVDGRPALWLAADTATTAPAGSASVFRDAVERFGRVSGAQFLSLTLPHALLNSESSVP